MEPLPPPGFDEQAEQRGLDAVVKRSRLRVGWRRRILNAFLTKSLHHQIQPVYLLSRCPDFCGTKGLKAAVRIYKELDISAHFAKLSTSGKN